MSPPADRPVVRVDAGTGGAGEHLGASPRRLPRPVVVAVVALLLVVVVAAVADGPLRRREQGQLADTARAAQQSIDFTDRRVSGTVQYVSPQLTSATTPPDVRADLAGIVQKSASGRVPALQARRDAVAATRLVPWHAAERKARTALLTYLDERLRLLRAVAADLAVLYSPTPQLTQLRDRATKALVDAGVARDVLGG